MEPAIAQPSTPYRKLPGRLRGMGYGASVWMAPDHLLLVNTRMFREDYKRFYLRDIQAIVMATRPRFLISTRSLAVAFAWLFPWIFWVLLPAGFGIAWWAVAAIIVGTWLVFSFFFSCTCRLYTAVSNDPLPSLYRTWTARKFLNEVKPWIDEVQGSLDANWAEAVESRAAGPVEAAPPTAPAAAAPALRTHTTACLVLVVSLLAEATLDLLTLHSVSTAVTWILTGLSLVQISSAILVMIERQRRILRAAMQRVAVAALVVQGLGYYVATTSAAFVNPGRFVGASAFSRLMLPQFILLREISSAIYIVLALIGLAIILLPAAGRPPDIIEN
ncbi:MAG: hypothetical protein ABSB88_05020 [Bryobacteraceae bacterium]|jgi:hypothetical protein